VDTDLYAELAGVGVARGCRLGLVIAHGVGVGLASGSRTWAVPATDPMSVVARIEAALTPRWTWWGREVADTLVAGGVRVSACWDVDAVHQLLFGGPRPGVAAGWARLHGLAPDGVPRGGQLDLLDSAVVGGGGDPESPVQPDGYLRPEWVEGGWRRGVDRLALWAATALACADEQQRALSRMSVGGDPMLTAWSESAAELLAAQLQADGLPVDVARAEQLVSAAAGPRPRDQAEADESRRERDALVLQHVRRPSELRNPSQVKAMLADVGIDVPDTRSWRLEPFRSVHPLVDALLAWRKAERIATTYGYSWLDNNVTNGRLRGAWLGSDGAAGRMTASAGLHNLPAELRDAVAAEPGHVFVRADLGQVEPRVLAVVSGDPDLARAGRDDDLYAPVAARLGVQRPVAKVAVLAAMYGQTSGTAGQALRGLTRAYPVAMAYLDAAYADGRAGRDVRTFGGRLVRMPSLPVGLDEDGVQAFQGGRGRYARNALVQGAAAEFFKIWAATVRARLAGTGAYIVLCLHDELLVHVPAEHASNAVDLVHDCVAEAAGRWQTGRPTAVRFLADVKTVQRWSEAK
jgi:DNA polymerase-1